MTDEGFEQAMLALYDDLNQRFGRIEAIVASLEEGPPPPRWAQGVSYLVDTYLTRKNALAVAGTLAAIYTTYFVAAAVNAPLT